LIRCGSRTFSELMFHVAMLKDIGAARWLV